MKKLFFILTAAVTGLMTVAVASCEKPEKQVEVSELTVRESLEIPFRGGSFTITYTIENPVAGVTLHAACEADWIHGLDDSIEGSVSFVADSNSSETARSTVMVLIYGDIRAEVSLIQGGSEEKDPDMPDEEFAVEIGEVGYKYINWTVIPADGAMHYLSMTVDKRIYDGLGSDEAYFEEEMSIFEMMAGYYGMTLQDYLSQITYTGTSPFYSDGLTPGYEYYVYAYGISLDGEMLTSIYKKEVTTMEPEFVDIKFDIACVPGLNTVEVSVSPSDAGQMYMVWYYVKDDLLSPIEEAFERDFEDMVRDKMASDGLSRNRAVEELSSKGDVTLTFEDLKGNTEYTAFAIAVNEEGLFVSDAFTEDFKTEGIESENVISVNIVETGADWVHYTVSTTNDDPYVMYFIQSSMWEGWEDSDIIDKLLGTYSAEKYYLYQGDQDSTLTGLQTKTEYVMYTFGCESGVATTPLGKTFFTPSPEETSLEISLDYGKYFDGDAVLEAYPELAAEYSDFSGKAILPIKASVSDPSATFLYYVYSTDCSDYDDDILYSSLSGGTGIALPEYAFARLYDRDLTVAGFAIDSEGNYGPLYRDTVYFTADGVSPASEFPIELFR